MAELQADDYQLDRQLYFACREDRERLCSSIVPGNGEVYKCLFKHKFDQQMSSEVGKYRVCYMLMQVILRVIKNFIVAIMISKNNGHYFILESIK